MPSAPRPFLALFLALTIPMACTMSADANANRPPAAGWDHKAEGREWTQATLGAISTKGRALVESRPADIQHFCPAYTQNSERERQAFWMGLFSALAKHESTWNPRAAGAGGKYRGLLQIAPATARAYGCDAGALYDGKATLACAVTIASRQVARTGVVVGEPGDWGGLAADWGPMRNAKKRAEIANWTRKQDYCAI